jgi:hypothetical protein
MERQNPKAQRGGAPNHMPNPKVHESRRQLDERLAVLLNMPFVPGDVLMLINHLCDDVAEAAVAASGSPPREPTAWLFQHDEGGRQVVIGAIDLRNMRNAKGWNEVGPLYLGAGRSPAEVPPTWKASEEVSAAREAFDKAEDEYVQARQYNEDEEFVIQATAIEATAKLEELLDAVWRSAQPHD